MRVTFTRIKGNRYRIAIERQQGPPLEPRFAPGFDEYMPHDLAHYVVEEQFAIQLGVFGQLAAGGGGIFTPAPHDNSLHAKRTAKRVGAVGREDMARSERLVRLCVAEWQRRSGRLRRLPPDVEESAVTADELDTAVRRLDEVATKWHALEPGRSLVFDWPAGLTFNPARSHRGRQSPRRVANNTAPGRGRRP